MKRCTYLALLFYVFVVSETIPGHEMSYSDKISREQEIAHVNLRDFEGNALKFATENIRNAKLRQEYIELSQKEAGEILQDARTKAMNANPSQQVQIWENAAKTASELRNVHLEQTRQRVSTTAAAFSKMLKEEGLTFPGVMQKYTRRYFGPDASYPTLRLEQQVTVMESVVEASGRTNPKINILSKVLGRFGYASIILTVGLSIYFITEAENPTIEFAKSAISLNFGVPGAIAGTKLGAYIGACGGPIGVVIGAIVGGIVGGFLSAVGAGSLLDLLMNSFLPPSYRGPGQPPFDNIPALYGQPKLDCSPMAPQPMPQGAPIAGTPAMNGNAVPRPLAAGPPKLW